MTARANELAERNIPDGTGPEGNPLSSHRFSAARCRPVSRRTKARKAEIMRTYSMLDWYRILRVHYQWPLFEAIRFALWLTR
jgi:hypothetical protein